MLTRGILLLTLAAISTPSIAGDVWSPALAQANPTPPQGAQGAPNRPPTGPKNFLGRTHPGKITGLSNDGIVVNLRDGGTQVVQFGEILARPQSLCQRRAGRHHRHRLCQHPALCCNPASNTLIDDLSKKVPMTKLTAPNGEIIYMVASKVTDIYNALPGLHNPASKAVVGTRDGTQQVLEAVDEAKKIIASAHVTQ